ncbi:MAG: hypothetical protein KKB74_09730, partial [Bacteroidetes bacterium]|nr:hypothetical protein [Bacteroidota bacterium]
NSGATNVYVYEGAVDITSNETGETKTLNQDEKAYIGVSGAIEILGMDTDSRNMLLGGVIILLALLITSVILFMKHKTTWGVVFAILTIALLVAGGIIITGNSPTTPDEQPEEVITEDNDIVSSPDNAFAMNLAPFNGKINFIVEQNDWSEASYIACYTLNDSNYESSNCPTGSAVVFSINLYSPDLMLEIINSPVYEGAYIVLYEFADSGAYLLEWPNGFYPEEIQGVNENYFNSIAETFMPKFGVPTL